MHVIPKGLPLKRHAVLYAAPNRYLPRFADLHGVSISPMLAYCGSLRSTDRLPRGLDARCGQLRRAIIDKINIAGRMPGKVRP